MFNITRRHPSDSLLVCGIDGELSGRRAAALDAHLRHCERCRARFAALAAVGDEITRAIRNEPEGPPARRDALRDRLRVQMTTRAIEWNHSWLFRLRRAALPLTLGIAGLAAVLVLIVRVIAPSHIGSSADLEVAALPIRAVTPGFVGPVNMQALCAGRAVERPLVAAAVRDVVLRDYRMEAVSTRDYELDYLITPELGGVADARNLWPERYATKVWNARVKDDLEELMPQLVCRGDVDLSTAQHEIAENWIAAYKKYFRTDRPVARRLGADGDRLRSRSARTEFSVEGPSFRMRRVALFVSARSEADSAQ